MNREKVERVLRGLQDGDVVALSRAVEHCGGYRGEPFKGLLVSTLQTGYDKERAHRLRIAVSSLSEEEIVWLCEQS